MDRQKISFKRGDALDFKVFFSKPDKVTPLDINVNSLKSELRNKNDILIAKFNITATANQGEFIFSIPSSVTRGFPINTSLFMDIEYEAGVDRNKSCETIEIFVEKDITKWE